MMSGMPREAPCYHKETTLLQKRNFCPYNTTEMLGRIKKKSLVMPPGVSPSYRYINPYYCLPSFPLHTGKYRTEKAINK